MSGLVEERRTFIHKLFAIPYHDMPPPIVKTIRELIYWQYAKLISKSAGMGIDARAFQMNRFLALRSGGIQWSTTIREYVLEHDHSVGCAYCGDTKNALTVDHIFPTSLGGPDHPDNAIRVCKSCNSKKGATLIFAWNGTTSGDEVPRIVQGKYLKLLFDMHEKTGTLDMNIHDIQSSCCAQCRNRPACVKAGSEGRLTMFCAEGIAALKNRIA